MERLKNGVRRLKLIDTLPKKSEVNLVLKSFSKKEWGIFGALLAVVIVSALLILNIVNKSFMSTVPLRGGELAEGIVGSPRFVNPVLAFSDVDRDLIPLVYSGLLRKDKDGSLVPDLAEKYEVSPDGLSYTFTLKEDLKFHDGSELAVEDVIFTIEKIKDPQQKSPRRAAFEGVSMQKIDDRTVAFTLRQSYASFLENMTVGILPQLLWNQSPLELNDLNTKPVGSGPYKISKVGKQASGIITYYELESFGDFAMGSPYIKKLTLRFYPNESDMLAGLRQGAVSQVSSITPGAAEELEEDGYRVESSVLPRIFGLFFNQNQKQIFTNKTVVRAINDAIDKDRIVRQVLGGYGVVINDPIPPELFPSAETKAQGVESREEAAARVKNNLAKDGWKMNSLGFMEKTVTEKGKKTTSTLEFSISTGNAPELANAAELIKEDLGRVGMKVDIKTFEVGNLNQSVIRPRNYDVLLFGQIINNESDLYAFWHSSQRKDPGLNVAMYTNAKVDKILEEAFVTLKEDERAKKYAQFQEEVKRDMPAVFLYSPKFVYIVDRGLRGLDLAAMSSPTERFRNAYAWYTETDNVWKIFTKN